MYYCRKINFSLFNVLIKFCTSIKQIIGSAIHILVINVTFTVIGMITHIFVIF